jgi:polyhydroxyalkanoate synthesis regulator phasin
MAWFTLGVLIACLIAQGFIAANVQSASKNTRIALRAMMETEEIRQQIMSVMIERVGELEERLAKMEHPVA